MQRLFLSTSLLNRLLINRTSRKLSTPHIITTRLPLPLRSLVAMSDSESSQDFVLDQDSDSDGYVQPAKSKSTGPAKKIATAAVPEKIGKVRTAHEV